ncbi:MAG TPA: hypothetical protein VMV44_15565 [Rectinemataceae bacterium]|nr:hypothetical protein [Rectinemataceae bacterium]
MSETNPLFDKKVIETENVTMHLTPMPGSNYYHVQIIFPLDALRVYASKWANPLRVALEAADEALNALKREIYAQELNEGKPYEKPKFPVEPSEEKKP